MTWRDHFPIFRRHPDLIYLDSASTSQRLDRALEAMERYHLDENANVHRGIYPLSEQVTADYEAIREVARRFLNAPSSRSIIFTHGTTESLNLLAHTWGRQNLKPGDEILLTHLEHHANLVPWQIVAKETGAKLVFIPLTSEGEFDFSLLDTLITPRTRIASVTGLSNVLGTLPDLSRLRAATKKVGALLSVDAAQLAAHCPIDVQAMDVDFLAFSGHKIYGPTGAGILYGREGHLEAMNPWMGGGAMIRTVSLEDSTWNEIPWKFEAGTPPIASILGMGAAMEFLMEVGFEAITHHDLNLEDALISGLNQLPFIKIYGPQDFSRRRGAISFSMEEVHPHDIAALLGEVGICVRAGHHCAMPLMQALKSSATTRVSFGIYNSVEEVLKLLEALKSVHKKFTS